MIRTTRLGTGLFYEDQKPEALRRSRGFVLERLPKYPAVAGARGAAQPDGFGAFGGGDAVTTADLSLFQMVEGLQYAFPNAMDQFERNYPQLTLVHAAVAEMPTVAAYVASDRRVPFSEEGHLPLLPGTGRVAFGHSGRAEHRLCG